MQHFDINAYRWHSRLLLLFAPDSSHPDYVRQWEMLEDAEEGIAERDLFVFMLFEEEAGFAGRQVASPVFAADVRGQFDVAPGEFTALLIGKDGTVKRRFAQPVSTFELFTLIDAMPMRRREMRASDS